MTTTAHTLVKNEARFVWFAIMSVIDHVDKVLLWDTGSTDGTQEIIHEIKRLKKDKVDVRMVGDITIDEFAKVRQDMLTETKTDWILVVDADEIWWDESIKKLINIINTEGEKLESIVVPTINLVGDIFHYQEDAAGMYQLAGERGHLGLRALSRNIPGLSSDRPHGTWGWVDGEGKMIQDRSLERIKYVEAPYLHASFLPRSGERSGDVQVPKRAKKLKHEIGISFPLDYYYPEVLFRPRPKFIDSPWRVMSQEFKVQAYLQTPLRKVKRRLIKNKVGY